MDTTCGQILAETSISVTGSGVKNLEGIQYFKSLSSLEWTYGSLDSIRMFPKRLKQLRLTGNNLKTIPAFPDSLEGTEISNNQLRRLPALPFTLTNLYVSSNQITSIPSLPAGLLTLDFLDNKVTAMPALNSALIRLDCSDNPISNLGQLPTGLRYLTCVRTGISNLPPLPPMLFTLNCQVNNLTSLPVLPPNLGELVCSSNSLTVLPALPATLRTLFCTNTLLGNNFPKSLPPVLQYLYCSSSGITSLPRLPTTLVWMEAHNNNIYCLPLLPSGLKRITIDTDKVRCLPNNFPGLTVQDAFKTTIPNYPVCNTVNNVNGCSPFPVVQGRVFYDVNQNGMKDSNEYYKEFTKINLTNKAITYTNDSGFYQLSADTLGVHTLKAVVPALFKAVPDSAVFNFSRYDTVVSRDIALQPTVIKDSLKIAMTGTSWRARPGFAFTYALHYENAGTTNFSSANIVFHFDTARLNYISSSSTAVLRTGNQLTLQTGALPIAGNGGFYAFFTVKTTTKLGDTIKADASIISGSIVAVDTVQTLVTGAFDPNDKAATAVLTPEQVAKGEYIDYVVRYQNTGTDTAFHVVVADTLSNMLQWKTLGIVSSSHLTKATVRDNVVMFEMRNIMLPDRNVNERASHGYIRFRIKPVSTLAAGNTVNNKAAIYFDYNSPVITNTAVTQIVSQTFPLKLISFKGRLTDNNINLYWYTNNEMNTKTFVIERSLDGRTFEMIGETKAKGYGNNNYSFNVNKVGAEVVYFRLKMVDNDGHYTYSPVISIRRRQPENPFVIGSNPVKDKLIITGINSSLLNTETRIVNSMGVVVKRFMINSASQIINVSTLPAGLYYLHTQQGSVKVLIER